MAERRAGTLQSRQDGDDHANGVVSVTGELDAHHGHDLQRRLLDLLDGGHSTLVVDTSRVTFLDSSGLRVLVAADERCRAAGGALRLRAPSAQVRYVLRLADLADRFVSDDDRA